MQMREHSPPDFPALDLIHMWVVRLRSYLMASQGSGGKCWRCVVRRCSGTSLLAGSLHLLLLTTQMLPPIVDVRWAVPSSSVEVAVNGSGSDKESAGGGAAMAADSSASDNVNS